MQPCLSPRETTVLRLLAWGHTNKEIATRLELSVKTIESHRSNGMRKLKLRDRAALVRYAVDKDWLAGDATPRFETDSPQALLIP